MEIPWHPVLVHFPIALLLVGGGAAVLWLATGRAFWRQMALALVFLGAVGAFAAKQSGEDLEHQHQEAGGSHEDSQLHEHATRGKQTVIAAALALAALAFAQYRARKHSANQPDPLPLRAVATLLAVAAAGLVVSTGHLGGTMTWGEPHEEHEAPPDSTARPNPVAGLSTTVDSLPR